MADLPLKTQRPLATPSADDAAHEAQRQRWGTVGLIIVVVVFVVLFAVGAAG